MSDNLFGGVMLGEDFLDIPNTPEEGVESTPVVEKPKGTPAVEDEDDNFIEVVVGTTHKEPSEEDDDLSPDGFKEETDDETPPNTKGSSSSSPIKPFVKALAEEGFLPSIEDDDFDALVEEQGGAMEALMELSRRAIKEDIEEYKKTADADFKSFLEARDAGLDLNQWADVQEAKKFYSAITEDKIDEDEDIQKDLIREHLRIKNVDEETIEATIDSFETTGKLADNAKKAHKNLVKFTEEQEGKLKEDKIKRDEADKRTREENIKSLRKEVDVMNEIIPGIKINKQTKDKIFSNITSIVKNGPNGEPLNTAMAKRAEDPLKYAIIENYLIELGVFDGKWDKVIARSKSKAVSELEKSLSDKSNTDFKGGKSTLGGGGSDDDDFDFRLPKFK